MRSVVLVALAVLTSTCGSSSAPRVNVLLITVDTLRADYVGRFDDAGRTRSTTPNLDVLASEGLAFTKAMSPRAKTTPALASLLSGRYPHEHGVRDLVRPLGDDVALLQEDLREAGYVTGAIVGNWVLGRLRSGLQRGFDAWCEQLPDTGGVPPDKVPQRNARSLTDGALVALGLAPTAPDIEPAASFVRADRPWFLWLHYMDPHGAYEPPVEHRVFESATRDLVATSAEDDGADALHRRRIALYNVPNAAFTDAEHFDANAVRDLYAGEVHYVDAEIGRLLDALRARGELERTLVVVTSDHGESLGEHRYWFEHGAYAYETTCHVPLIVRWPEALPGRPSPGVRHGAISLVELASTIADVVGLDGSDVHVGGTSRRALFCADEAAPHAVFCEKVERAELDGVVQIKAVRYGEWKLLQRYASRALRGAASAREAVLVGEELYDLGVDPLESWDLSALAPGTAPMAVLRRELAGFVAQDDGLAELAELLQRQREGLAARDPEALRILHALGY